MALNRPAKEGPPERGRMGRGVVYRTSPGLSPRRSSRHRSSLLLN